jgi:threonine/homoserine/homoserine lactone efflux protein
LTRNALVRHADLVPSPTTYALFVLAALALLVIPGPAVLYVVAQSVGGGRRAGLASVLGLHTGTLVHIAAAAAGISGLIVASSTAFSVVKYAGAAYLIVLGLRRLATRERVVETVPVVDHRRLFRDGIVVNVLNPKTALFFLAFLPQFVDPRGSVPLEVVALGLTFLGLGLVTDSLWAVGAGAAGERLRRSRVFPRVERWVSGSIFVALGVATAVAGAHRSRS